MTGERSSWDASLDVDVMGAVRLVEAVLPMMRERQQGTILLVDGGQSRAIR